MSIELVTKHFKENKSLYQISKMLSLPLTSVREMANESKIIGHRLAEFCRANRGKTVVLFDLETTGLPASRGFNRFYPYTENRHYESARIVQLAYCRFVIGETSETDLKLFDFLRKPEGFQISPASFEVHGISQSYAEKHGKSFETVLAESDFIQSLQECDWIISHNIQFDYNILCNEMYRLGKVIPEEWALKLECTCRMTDFTRLQVLYQALVDNSPNDLNFHDARSDVLALYRVIQSVL